MGDVAIGSARDVAVEEVTPRLSLRDISKSFHGITVLEEIDLDIAPGEVHAVVGENGAGKSTLMKIVAGAHVPSSGTIRLDGDEVSFHHPRQARDAGVGIVYQELNLLPDRTVAENLYLGAEPSAVRGLGLLDRSSMIEGARLALEAAGVDSKIRPRTMARDLSVADRQMVEIARALMADTRLVIFDEPTAALSGAEATELFERIQVLRDRGISVLYVSHRLPEIFALSDRITVLKDGRKVGTVDSEHATRDQIVAMMVGRELSNYYPERARADDVGGVAVRVSGGSNADLHDIDLELRAGEIVGVAGLAGSGRTELARALFGVVPFRSGVVEVGGRAVDIRNPRQAIRHGMGFVTEDRKGEGLVPGATSQQNGLLALRALGRRLRARRLAGADPGRYVADLLRRFELRTRAANQPVGLLSGGNQQKVVLAKWMSTNATIMLFDEPTRGIDVGAKSAIHDLLRDLARAGLAVMMISSELPEVIGMSDRIVVMRDRTIAGELPAGAAETDIMRLATGESIDPAALAAQVVEQ